MIYTLTFIKILKYVKEKYDFVIALKSGEKIFVSFPLFNLNKYNVIAQPRKLSEGNWAGAPSVVYDGDSDEYWLVYRVRDVVERGIEIHIAKSKDGLRFKDELILTREDLGDQVISVERSSILKNPNNGKFMLYISYEKDFARGSFPKKYGRRGRWVISKFEDVDDPRDFDPNTLRTVLTGSPGSVDNASVKDPYVFAIGKIYLMYYIGAGTFEQTFLAYSNDGIKWEKYSGNPVFTLGGWHDYATRPCSILPIRNGFLLIYGGSNVDWYAPVYNIASGFAYTQDFKNFIDLTPISPVLTSPTSNKYKTVRYCDVLKEESRILLYYEAARIDDAFETRVSFISIDNER